MIQSELPNESLMPTQKHTHRERNGHRELQMPNKWCLNSGFKGINLIIKLSAITRFAALCRMDRLFVCRYLWANKRRKEQLPMSVYTYKFIIIRELHTRDDLLHDDRLRWWNQEREKNWATTWCWFYPIILISIGFRWKKKWERKKNTRTIISLIIAISIGRAAFIIL